MRILFLLAALTGAAAMAPAAAQDRSVIDASAPETVAVTVYRDPNRELGDAMEVNWPEGFAMISETRSITLPQGRSTVRFDGVAEGMIAVSAIVTGLPGGTIEKNRNADLLSPAALVNGALGNRVTITRTNPATGERSSERAIVRTRADGGLVLQTGEAYEAVRCSGLPERLTFDSVPAGLSPNPVFSIDTYSETGGTWAVTLTYLAWGFDWQANYVATIHEGRKSDDVRFDLTSWLTILNNNGQSFEGAELMAVAGTLNIVTDYEELAEPPSADPLYLTCYPIGSTAAGTPMNDTIVVTAGRFENSGRMMNAPMAVSAVSAEMMDASVAMLAGEEALGDLKLYRVPVPVNVNAQGLKQVAFLQRRGAKGRLVYEANCQPSRYASDKTFPASIKLETVNDEEHGMGASLPFGAVAIFERGGAGEMLVGETALRDYAVGQEVEISLGESAQVFAQCSALDGEAPHDNGKRAVRYNATLTNANPTPVTMRLLLGSPRDWNFDGVREVLHEGQRVLEVSIPANGTRTLGWRVKSATQ